MALCTSIHIASHRSADENPAKHERSSLSAFAESLGTAVALVVQADPVLMRTVALSLVVSGSACAIAAGLGLAGGAWLAATRFPGRRALLTLLNTLALFLYLRRVPH